MCDRRKVRSAVPLALLAMGGCIRTYTISPQSPPGDFAAASRLTDSSPTTVETTRSERHEFATVELRPDSLVGSSEGSRVALALCEVSSFQTKNRRRGVFDGLIAGAVLGAAYVAVTTIECGEECHIFTGCRPVSCFRGNPLIAISVAGLGALLGAAQKATIRYNVVTSLRPR